MKNVKLEFQVLVWIVPLLILELTAGCKQRSEVYESDLANAADFNSSILLIDNHTDLIALQDLASSLTSPGSLRSFLETYRPSTSAISKIRGYTKVQEFAHIVLKIKNLRARFYSAHLIEIVPHNSFDAWEEFCRELPGAENEVIEKAYTTSLVLNASADLADKRFYDSTTGELAVINQVLNSQIYSSPAEVILKGKKRLVPLPNGEDNIRPGCIFDTTDFAQENLQRIWPAHASDFRDRALANLVDELLAGIEVRRNAP